MCGLAVVQLAKQKRKPEEWRRIKTLFTQNLLANQERGREATGVALIQAHQEPLIIKQAIPADEFVRGAQYQNVLNSINENTIGLLGHTRKPTKGTPQNMLNNHPIKVNQLVGIHNGQIKNDDELFSQNRLPRQGSVDSEIIFQLLSRVNPVKLNSERYFLEVKQQVKLLNGDYTFIFIDLRKPNQIVVVKKNQPLSFHWDTSLGVLFFSSRYLFLRKAFGATVVSEKIHSKHIFGFDNSTLIDQNGQPSYSLPF